MRFEALECFGEGLLVHRWPHRQCRAGVQLVERGPISTQHVLDGAGLQFTTLGAGLQRLPARRWTRNQESPQVRMRWRWGWRRQTKGPQPAEGRRRNSQHRARVRRRLRMRWKASETQRPLPCSRQESPAYAAGGGIDRTRESCARVNGALRSSILGEPRGALRATKGGTDGGSATSGRRAGSGRARGVWPSRPTGAPISGGSIAGSRTARPPTAVSQAIEDPGARLRPPRGPNTRAPRGWHVSPGSNGDG